MKWLLMAAAALFAMTAHADDGVLNPEEGGIAQLREALSSRPDRAGFICWVVYETQKGGLHEEAFDALHDCAESGNAPSMILLSHAYENGLGAPADPERATQWVRRAALSGYPLGQYHYGMALIRGYGVAQDSGQGRYWLEQAAEAGDENAAEVLHSM